MNFDDLFKGPGDLSGRPAARYCHRCANVLNASSFGEYVSNATRKPSDFLFDCPEREAELFERVLRRELVSDTID